MARNRWEWISQRPTFVGFATVEKRPRCSCGWTTRAWTKRGCRRKAKRHAIEHQRGPHA